MLETEKAKPKRPISIIVVMIWTTLGITFLTTTFSHSLMQFFNLEPPPGIVGIFRILIVFLIIKVLVNLWRLNLKAIYFADAVFGVWNLLIVGTIFMDTFIKPILERGGVFRLTVIFLVNLSLLVYLTRHTFLDRCEVLNKLLKDQKREQERFKQLFKVRKL